MHTKAMDESEGEFSSGCGKVHTCRNCNKKSAYCEMWESSCGGYEDYKITCNECGYVKWEEGPDA